MSKQKIEINNMYNLQREKQVNLLKFEFEGRARSRAKADKIEKEKV